MLKAFSLVNFLIPQQQVVGLYLDGTQVRKAVLGISGTSFSIKKLETVQEITPQTGIYSCCIASKKTIGRPIEIALTKQKDIDATYAFEAESHLPYPLDECIVDKITLQKANASTTLQLFSVKKTDLQDLLDKLTELSINPENICPKAVALSHYVERLYKESGEVICIDIDSEETTCVRILEGKPLATRSHPVGLKSLSSITSTNEAGEVQVNDKELESLQQYIRELSRILLAFGHESQNLPILFTGPVVENSILIELLTNALGRTRITLSNQAYAVAIGAALSVNFEEKGQSINFRKDEFAYPDKWKRWKKELVLYFCLMLLLSTGGYFYGKSILRQQHEGLIEQYATLMNVLERPVDENELIAMLPDDIDEKLSGVEAELKDPKEEMALHPDVPRVSDLLAWLGSHPNVKIGGDDPKSISLEALSYNMVKRPEKGKLKEHYQVKVELEFSSPSPTMARELHDALLQPNDFIDPKNELKWSVQRGHFKAIFFLKDRTKYTQIAQGASP